MDQGTTHSTRCACGGSLTIHADGNRYLRAHRSIEGTQYHDEVTAAQITAAAPGDDPRYRCPEQAMMARPPATGGPLPDPAAQPGVYSPRPSPVAPLNTTTQRCGCGGFVEWHEDVLRMSMRVAHITPEGERWEGEITHQLLAQSSLPFSCPLEILREARDRIERSRPAPPPAAARGERFVVTVQYADASPARSVVTQADLAAVRAALDAAGLPYTATPATAERAAS